MLLAILRLGRTVNQSFTGSMCVLTPIDGLSREVEDI